MRKDYRNLRRRPLFTPLWLTVLGGVVAIMLVIWLRGMAGTTTAIVVRHAEKLSAPATDPALSPAGVDRARALSRWLGDVPLTAVYVSEFRRSRETAGPVAEAKGLAITEVDLGDSTELADRLGEHRDEVVLVIGHRNSIPDLIEDLGGETTPIGEDEYSRLLIVTSGALTQTQVLSLRYDP